MSDADLEVSFGKLLMLGFSNYATGNHLASCGHSLQRDCLRYYGFGSMVIIFQYSAVEIFSVGLPSPTLETGTTTVSAITSLLLPDDDKNDEPTTTISYALTSKQYHHYLLTVDNNNNIHHPRTDDDETSLSSSEIPRSSSTVIMGSLLHPKISMKMAELELEFSVTCYFPKQFDALRKRYWCRTAGTAGEMGFATSLSCCSCAGKGHDYNYNGSSYFAKSFDERLFVKEVKKNDLESFEEFADEYFRHLTDSLCSGSPTCLTKILGIYQVAYKHSNGDKEETKMDLMVMENIFFKRKISRIYSIKDTTARSHSISKMEEAINQVLLLDMKNINTLEIIPTIPIFLISKSKTELQRIVWNDTGFLGSVNVTDYSLLVGADEECQELVIGIIDFMKQYTEDKQDYSETWIKSFCNKILGTGTKHTAIINSSIQYKKRFRKAVDASFLILPYDHIYG